MKTAKVYEDELYRLVGVHSIDKKAFSRVLKKSKSLIDYNNRLNVEFGQNGVKLYRESRIIFSRLINIDPSKEIFFKNTKNIQILKRISKNKNMSLEVVCNTIKESKTKEEYHNELRALYGVKGISFYKNTRNIFNQVEKEIS